MRITEEITCQLHNLEILKIRFGDSSLHVCDVMTKDLTDSRRVNQRIQKDINEEVRTFEAYLVHYLHFRPAACAAADYRFPLILALDAEDQFADAGTVRNVPFVLAKPITSVILISLHSLQGNYEKAFRLQKPDKKLHWIPNMGVADLTIQMNDGRELNVSVTPLQAAVVELFSQTCKFISCVTHAVAHVM